MKAGARVLGVAFSDGPETAVLAGALVRADRVVDGLSFASCTVGGVDAPDAVVDCFETLDREDVRWLLLAGVAPAWFNLVDLAAVRDAVDRPVVAVSFEESDGLEPALREHFSGEALDRRLAVYDRLPPRSRVTLGDRQDGDGDGGGRGGDGSSGTHGGGATSAGHDVWVRAVGMEYDRARELVRGVTPEGTRRPEPVRVARIAARAARTFHPGTGRDVYETP